MKMIALAGLALTALSIECSAQNADGPSSKTLDGKMICSAYSTNPEKQPAFQLPFPIASSGGVLSAERKLVENPGKEIFHGLIGSLSHEVVMIGEGRRDSGNACVGL